MVWIGDSVFEPLLSSSAITPNSLKSLEIYFLKLFHNSLVKGTSETESANLHEGSLELTIYLSMEITLTVP